MVWKLQPDDEFTRREKQYRKKRPRELKAVAYNLNRYFEALEHGTPPKQIQAGWIHPEPMDIVALDQKGANEALGGKNKAKGLAETRLYVYPEVETEILHTITLGDKSTQSDDIQYSIQYVESLASAREACG
jgi:hypothetical protein